MVNTFATPVSKRVTRSQHSDISDISDNEQILESITKRRRKSVKPKLDTVDESNDNNNAAQDTQLKSNKRTPKVKTSTTKQSQPNTRRSTRSQPIPDEPNTADNDISDDYVEIDFEDVNESDIDTEHSNSDNDTINNIEIKHKSLPQYTDTEIQQLQHNKQQHTTDIDNDSDSDVEPEEQTTATAIVTPAITPLKQKRVKQSRPIAKSKQQTDEIDENAELPDDILQAVAEYDKNNQLQQTDHDNNDTADIDDKLSHIDDERLQRILGGDLHSSDDDIDIDTLMAASKRMKGLDIDLSQFADMDNGLTIDTTVKSKRNFLTDNGITVDGINVVVNEQPMNKQHAMYQFAYKSVQSTSDYIERTLFNDRHTRAPMLKKYRHTLGKPNKVFLRR